MICTPRCGRDVAEKDAKAKESLKHTMLYIQQQQRDRLAHDADVLQVWLPPVPPQKSMPLVPLFLRVWAAPRTLRAGACHELARARNEFKAMIEKGRMDSYVGMEQANKREAQQVAREFEAANVKDRQAREAVLRRNLVNRDQLVLQISAQDEVCVCARAHVHVRCTHSEDAGACVCARMSICGARTVKMRERHIVQDAAQAACRVRRRNL